jgi:hypothetical protein
MEKKMTERDMENLKFLLAIDAIGLQSWMNQAELDDLLYAEELLHFAILSDVDKMTEKSDLAEAKEYLQKFSRKNNA